MGQIDVASLQELKLLALDTPIFIYFLEDHPRYFPVVKDIFTTIEAGECAATASSLIFTELMVPAYRREASGHIREVFRLLTNFPNLSITGITPTIALEASRLRAAYNLRTPDALHVAAALSSNAQAILTNDLGFQAVADEIEVLLLET